MIVFLIASLGILTYVLVNALLGTYTFYLGALLLGISAYLITFRRNSTPFFNFLLGLMFGYDLFGGSHFGTGLALACVTLLLCQLSQRHLIFVTPPMRFLLAFSGILLLYCFMLYPISGVLLRISLLIPVAVPLGILFVVRYYAQVSSRTSLYERS